MPAVAAFVTDVNSPVKTKSGRANGPNAFALPAKSFTDWEVVSTTDVTHAVPANATTVLFSATDDFAVNYDVAAEFPSGAVSDGSGSDLNPVVVDIQGVTNIHLIALSAGVRVQMKFYYHVPDHP